MTRTEIEKFNEIRLFDERDIFIKALKKTAKKMASNDPVNEKDLRELDRDQWTLFIKNLSEYGASERAIELSKNFLKKYQSKLPDSKKTNNQNGEISIMQELIDAGLIHENPQIEDFAETFDRLKQDFKNRYIECSGREITIGSDEMSLAYENHIMDKGHALPVFNNHWLIGFTAYNKCNDGGGSRLDPPLFREAFEYIADNSPSVAVERIAKMDINEMRQLLLKYMSAGGRLAGGDEANENKRQVLLDNKLTSSTISILRTVRDLSGIVAALPDPTINGLCNHLIGLASEQQDIGTYNIWNSAHLEIRTIYGYGPALAPNFVKDLLLGYWNSEGKSIDELRGHVIGQTNKPDIHLKRMICFLFQPGLLNYFNDYNQFKDDFTNSVLEYSGPTESWEKNYYHKISLLCDQANTYPLELDRVLYGLMNKGGQFQDGLIHDQPINTVSPTIEELRGMLQ